MKRKVALIVLVSLCMTSLAQRDALNTTFDGWPRIRQLQNDSVRIGVSLCGGSAKGYAHLGFLQAMDDAGIKIDCISGTSMGAIVGMFYAAGYSPMEIIEIIKHERMLKKRRIFRLNLKRDGGLADMSRMREMMLKYVPHDSFDSLKIPFYCCVTDVTNARPVYVSTGGRLCEWVTASASIPRVFAPMLIDSVYYVDGYILNNLPVEPLVEAGCNVRIGVFFVGGKKKKPLDNPKDVAAKAFALNSNLCTYDHLHLCTHKVGINVHGLKKLDFDKIDEFYLYGYQAGIEFLQKLLKQENENGKQ